MNEIDQLPENMIGEIIGGELSEWRCPSPLHQYVRTGLSADLRQSGRLVVPSVAVLLGDQDLVVPDLTAWRRERLNGHEHDNPVTIRPDWVCEILSPSTRLKDLGPKRLLYARHGIPHLWIVDPEAQSLEAFELQNTRWSLLGMWSQREIVKGIAPFPEFTFDLSKWWLTPT